MVLVLQVLIQAEIIAWPQKAICMRSSAMALALRVTIQVATIVSDKVQENRLSIVMVHAQAGITRAAITAFKAASRFQLF